MKSNFFELPPCFLSHPIAHRGLHSCDGLNSNGKGPENSHESISEALSLNFGIEIDVRFSSDHIPIVIHDDNLLRLCGLDISVSDSNAETLFEICLSNSDRIPSLEGILNLVNGRVPLLIEVKEIPKDQDINFVTKPICDLMNRYCGPLAVMSFDWKLILALEKQNLKKPRGLVSQVFDKDWGLLKSDIERMGINEASLNRHGISFISHYCTNLSQELYKKNVKSNRKVLAWTVTDKLMANRVRNNCDNITFEGFLP